MRALAINQINEKISNLLKAKELNDTHRLKWYIKNDEINEFLELAKKRRALTFPLLRFIYANSYNISEYLENMALENVDELRTITDPDHFDKVFNTLTISVFPYKTYPLGYKQYRALKYVDENHPKTRNEIIKLLYELSYGPGSFHPFKNCSFWSDSYHNTIGVYLKEINGVKHLNDNGKIKLRELENKFGKMNIDSYV